MNYKNITTKLLTLSLLSTGAIFGTTEGGEHVCRTKVCERHQERKAAHVKTHKHVAAEHVCRTKVCERHQERRAEGVTAHKHIAAEHKCHHKNCKHHIAGTDRCEHKHFCHCHKHAAAGEATVKPEHKHFRHECRTNHCENRRAREEAREIPAEVEEIEIEEVAAE